MGRCSNPLGILGKRPVDHPEEIHKLNDLVPGFAVI